MSDHKKHKIAGMLSAAGLMILLVAFEKKFVQYFAEFGVYPKLNVLRFSSNYIDVAMYIIFALVVAYYYSILPDIDHHTSKITLELNVAAFILCGYALFVNKSHLAMSIACLIIFVKLGAGFFLKHRGFMHSIPAGGILALLLKMLHIKYVWFFVLIGFVSYVSHLWMDGLWFKLR